MAIVLIIAVLSTHNDNLPMAVTPQHSICQQIVVSRPKLDWINIARGPGLSWGGGGTPCQLLNFMIKLG